MIQAPDLEYLKRHLHENRLVLFLGAGFSMGAKNSFGRSLPSSKELASALWEYLGYQGEYDGTHIGIVYQAALRKPGGAAKLHPYLQAHLNVVEYPDWYRGVNGLYWYRIYTTNVDNLVELVFQDGAPNLSLDQVVAPCEYQDRDQFLKRIQYVKLHGSLDARVLDLTFSPVEYARRAVEQDVWYDHFVRDVTTKPALFVGTELDEALFWQYLAIRQRRNRDNPERRPKSFLVCPSVSPAKRESLSEFNIVPIEMTAEAFFSELLAAPGLIRSRQEILSELNPGYREIRALETKGLPSREVEQAEEFFSVFHLVESKPATQGGRSHFLLGSPPTWEDIYAELDAEREVNDTVRRAVTDELANEENGLGIILLTGAAGSGKTTIARRASLLILGEGYPVYYSTNLKRLLPDNLISYLKGFERRIVLVFDDAADELRRIRELADLCRDLPFPPVFLIALRRNEIALKRYVLEGLERVIEVRVPDLTDPDIEKILSKLDRHGVLGKLRDLKPAERTEVFRTKARKQILVAMREATSGKGFDEIIRDEFYQIEPKEARLAYLIAAIPSMYHYFVDRGQLISALGLSPNYTAALIDDTLNGILVPHEGVDGGLHLRHPVIADLVVREHAPREFLAQAYVHFLEILAHDLPKFRDRKTSKIFRIYQKVINHESLHTIFVQQVDLCRMIYESVKPYFLDDGHYFLQYGAYELEWGDLDFAENYLTQAESLMPSHPWVATEMGYLWMRNAVESTSPLAAAEYLEKGSRILERQIETDGRNNPYPHHVLGSQMLAYINRWSPAEKGITALRELYVQVAKGAASHPHDVQLKTLLESIKRAELMAVSRE